LKRQRELAMQALVEQEYQNFLRDRQRCRNQEVLAAKSARRQPIGPAPSPNPNSKKPLPMELRRKSPALLTEEQKIAARAAVYEPKELTGFLRRFALHQVRTAELQRNLVRQANQWVDGHDCTGISQADIANHIAQAVTSVMVPDKAEQEHRQHLAEPTVQTILTKQAKAAKGQLGRRWGLKNLIFRRTMKALPVTAMT